LIAAQRSASPAREAKRNEAERVRCKRVLGGLFVETVLDLLRSQNQSFDFSFRFTRYLRGGFLLFAYFLAPRFHMAHNFILHLQGGKGISRLRSSSLLILFCITWRLIALTCCRTIYEAILAGRATTTSGLARELGFSRHFVRYHLWRIERLGLVRRTMVRVLVTRERLVPTDDPA
jgi:hypothetical protein